MACTACGSSRPHRARSTHFPDSSDNLDLRVGIGVMALIVAYYLLY